MTDIPTLKASEYLRAARVRRGWNQTRCAEELGVHPITISSWENGHSRPHPENLGKIAEVLDIDPALFMNKPDHSTAVNFGQLLRRARKEAGLTVEVIAYDINRSPRTVEGWERGEQVPNAENIRLLERAYDRKLEIGGSRPAPMKIEKVIAHLVEGLRSLKSHQRAIFDPQMEALCRHANEIIGPVYNVKASNENSRDERVRRLAPPNRAWGQVS